MKLVDIWEKPNMYSVIKNGIFEYWVVYDGDTKIGYPFLLESQANTLCHYMNTAYQVGAIDALTQGE